MIRGVLVLATIGTVVGLAVAKVSLGWGLSMISGAEGVPFWIDDSLSWRTVLYASATEALKAEG